MLIYRGYKIPPPPTGPAPEPPGSRDPYDFGGFRESIEQRQYNQFDSSQHGASQFNNGGGFIGGAQRHSMMVRPSYLPYREREDEVGSNELLERDVQPAEEYARVRPRSERKDESEERERNFNTKRDQQLLNHCFDDIEKFVARLQQAAEAYKELERRKKERGGKGKKNASGDGMLGHRARPPPAQDFVDIFQKFKLSFNLLAKLKAHIHDPNAPELVHFLFTPLSLIYEASRDPIHGSMNLGEQAAAPVLTQDAKQLLLNCLTSKEIELWQALGKNWTTSKDEWKGYVPPYIPRFYDGWQPAPTLVDEPVSRPNLEMAVVNHHEQIRHRAHEQETRDYVQGRVMPFPPEEERFHRDPRDRDFERFDPDPRATTPPRNAFSNSSVVGFQQYVEQHIDRNYRTNDVPEQRRAPEPQRPPPVSQPVMPPRPPDDNAAYLEELRRTGSSAYEVLHDRQGKNQKELTVNKGDILQVLDNSRNWWKVRNYKGESGYCPYTILKEITNSTDNNRDLGSSMNASAEQSMAADKKSSRRDHIPDPAQTGYGAGHEASTSWFDGNRPGAPSRFNEDPPSPSQWDENPRGLARYDENPRGLTQYDENPRGLTQYDENPRGLAWYDENPRGLARYDENQNTSSQFDENPGAFSRYGERHQRTSVSHEAGAPSRFNDYPTAPSQWDESPRDLPRYNENRRISSESDENPGDFSQYERNRRSSSRSKENPGVYPRLDGDRKVSSQADKHPGAYSQFNPNPGPSSQMDETRGPSSRFEETHIPPLSLEDEEAEVHAFRPVEPHQYPHRGAMGIRKTQPQDDLHNELRSKMGRAPGQYRPPGRGGGMGGENMGQPTSSRDTNSPVDVPQDTQFYITRKSSHAEVATWLQMKAFSTYCRQTLQGFTGSDLFSLHRQEMEQLIGHEEATRLEGQLTLQKKMTHGYKTQSAAELNAIFQKRRARANQQGAQLGQPPDFRPSTPDSYDGPDSNSDDDNRQLAETGKTLRDLLIRQRRKIVGTSVFQQQQQ